MHLLHQLNNKILGNSLARFTLVGCLTVLIDFVFYIMLLFFEIEIDLAKAIGFTVGAIFAYFANKGYTFSSQRKNMSGIILFAALYGISLTANVEFNKAVLVALGASQLSVLVAFIIATAISATLNFLGMRYIIFKKSQQ